MNNFASFRNFTRKLGLSEMTYQTSSRDEKLRPSRSIREGQSHRARSKLLNRSGLSTIPFTAGHKMQTVFGAPGDAHVYHSVSRASSSRSIPKIVCPLTESLCPNLLYIYTRRNVERTARVAFESRIYILVKLLPFDPFNENTFICMRNRIYCLFSFSPTGVQITNIETDTHIYVCIRYHRKLILFPKE